MEPLTAWLLEGDVSVQYLTRKYLLKEPVAQLTTLRKRIAVEGWGRALLSARQTNGHWGRDFYQPKWTNSHYTLLDLRYLEVEPVDAIWETHAPILQQRKKTDGTWPLQAHHPGQRHVELETVGSPRRLNTLRALRVLKHFEKI